MVRLVKASVAAAQPHSLSHHDDNGTTNASPSQKKQNRLFLLFLIPVGAWIAVIGTMNFQLHQESFGNELALQGSALSVTLKEQRDKVRVHLLSKKPAEQKQGSKLSRLGPLECENHGGPAPKFASEMVYWEDIPSDSRYVSPFATRKGHDKEEYPNYMVCRQFSAQDI
jgi:hypothetical protein